MKIIPVTARDMYRQLPGHDAVLPDIVTDTDRALADLRAARAAVTAADLEYRRLSARMMSMLRAEWSDAELNDAGFWTP